MKQQRLLSLDIVRGITVAGMILVNNGYGDSFPMLRHAEWNGLSVSDFVFPFFLFIMGVSLFLSLSKTGFCFSGRAVGKIVKRSVLLFSIGIGINWFASGIWGGWTNFEELRFWAVLQRIALCYLLVALFALCGRPRLTLPLVVALLVGYGCVLVFGNGYSTEPDNNILYKVDEWMLGKPHLYKWCPIDPEGLLSTLCAMVNTLLGFYCAYHFKAVKELNGKIISIFMLGTVLVFCGFFLHFFFPYNKNVWSPSFALATSGGCALLLGLCMKWVDNDRRESFWKDVFTVFGSNALMLYVASEVMAILFGRFGVSRLLYDSLYAALPIPEFASLLYALCYVTLNGLIGYVLWRKRIYIKL